MTIRTRPATQEYRDNWPFPESDSEGDLAEAAANSVEIPDLKVETPEVGAHVLARIPCEGSLQGLLELMPGTVVCVQKRTMAVRLNDPLVATRIWTFFIRSNAWRPAGANL